MTFLPDDWESMDDDELFDWVMRAIGYLYDLNQGDVVDIAVIRGGLESYLENGEFGEVDAYAEEYDSFDDYYDDYYDEDKYSPPKRKSETVKIDFDAMAKKFNKRKF